MNKWIGGLLVSLACLSLAACGSSSNDSYYYRTDMGSAWGGTAPSDLGAPGGNGSFGNVGIGGGQDFAAFRDALNRGLIPSPASLDSTGFFAEHFTSLPPPECRQVFCLHGLLSVSPDLARGQGDWTLLQMGMNATVDPKSVKKPPLDVAVVIDHSGSMSAGNKMDYAKQGVKLLIEALAPSDTLTLIAFSDRPDRLFGPDHVLDKRAIQAQVDGLWPTGSTNIYDSLHDAYEAALTINDETQQRRVIFLTDGVPTAGNTDLRAIATMSAAYNDRYIGLTTIGLGSDVDAPFLRGLAETGGGNFYFIEKPEAVQEVFAEELAFFVAPIAYDLELSFEKVPLYDLAQVYGTNLWKMENGGGRIRVPSVFLASRTSSMPGGMGGGRRGGGAAIIAELTPAPGGVTLLHDVGKLHLRYREPGSQQLQTQDVTVQYEGTPGVAPPGGFYTDEAIHKNTFILDFYVAFRTATDQAQKDPRGARDRLQAFEARITPALAGTSDEDLLDDLKILRRYIEVLSKA